MITQGMPKSRKSIGELFVPNDKGLLSEKEIDRSSEGVCGYPITRLEAFRICKAEGFFDAQLSALSSQPDEKMEKQIAAKVTSMQTLHENYQQFQHRIARIAVSVIAPSMAARVMKATDAAENGCIKMKERWEQQARIEERQALEDKLRSWLNSRISDEEFCNAFGVSAYDCRFMFQEKKTGWNSYIGSLVDECDYPCCKVRQALQDEQLGGE